MGSSSDSSIGNTLKRSPQQAGFFFSTTFPKLARVALPASHLYRITTPVRAARAPGTAARRHAQRVSFALELFIRTNAWQRKNSLK
jgi:hypothetical protein